MKLELRMIANDAYHSARVYKHSEQLTRVQKNRTERERISISVFMAIKTHRSFIEVINKSTELYRKVHRMCTVFTIKSCERYNEHQYCVSSKAIEKSSIVVYAYNNIDESPHNIGNSNNNCLLIRHITDERKLNAYEAMHIYNKGTNLMNTDNGNIVSHWF